MVGSYVINYFCFYKVIRLVYMVVKDSRGYEIDTFLNRFFVALSDSYFDFLGIAVFSFFNLYLIWCVMKGTVSIGLKCLCLPVHQMKYFHIQNKIIFLEKTKHG